MALQRTLRTAALGTLAALVLASAAPALAGEPRESREIRVRPGTTLNGVALPEGTYQLRWAEDGSAETFEVTLSRGREVVAKASGVLVGKEQPAHYDAIAYAVQEDGTRAIAEIQFAGRRQVVSLTAAPTARR
jgi:hypothetical protein